MTQEQLPCSLGAFGQTDMQQGTGRGGGGGLKHGAVCTGDTDMHGSHLKIK